MALNSKISILKKQSFFSRVRNIVRQNGPNMDISGTVLLSVKISSVSVLRFLLCINLSKSIDEATNQPELSERLSLRVVKEPLNLRR